MPEPLTISAAAALIRAGELTPSQLLEQCLARIDRYEDRVRAWAFLDRDGAREQAARLDAEATAGDFRGPLHGIPVGIKDIIDVFDLPTGCGSRRWADSLARQDAACVKRLRQAGAVILGKTVTTAYASFDPPPTRNPWKLDCTPGGSSSGSAAAVACGMCLGALGTQTGGSITRPASYCGVASLKPTHGRVSTRGVLPLAPTLDHVGPMARSVRDLAVMFQVVAGPDGDRHDWFGTADHYDVPDCLAGLTDGPAAPPVPLVRLGGLFDDRAEPDLLAAYDDALKALEAEYAPIERAAPPAGFADGLAAHRLMMGVEAAEYHAARMARHPADYPPRVRELIEHGAAGKATDYFAAQKLMDDLRRQLARQLKGRVVFVTPAATSFAPPAATTGDAAFNVMWSFTGLPTASVPAGRSAAGRPFALQLVAAPGGEAHLLAAAHWCEHALGYPPDLPPVS